MAGDAFVIACTRYDERNVYIYFTPAEPEWHATQSLGEVLAEAEESDDAGNRFHEICEELGLVVALEYDSDSDSSQNRDNYFRALSETPLDLSRSITLAYHASRLGEEAPSTVWSQRCGAFAAAGVYAALRGNEIFDCSSSASFAWDRDARALQWNPARGAPSQAVVRDLIEAHARDFAAEGILAFALRSRGACRQDAIGWLWQRVPWADARDSRQTRCAPRQYLT